MTNSAPRTPPSRTPIRSKGQLLGGAFAYSLKLFPFLTGKALGTPPISRQIPDAKSRALQSLNPPSRTSVAGLPSDHFVRLPIGTSIKTRLEALRSRKPPVGGRRNGGRGYVGLLAFWIFTLAETRWWHLKQVDDGVPVLWD